VDHTVSHAPNASAWGKVFNGPNCVPYPADNNVGDKEANGVAANELDAKLEALN